MAAVGLLRDPVEQLGDLNELTVTLNQPLSILKATLLDLADYLNIRCQPGPLRHADQSRHGCRFHSWIIG